MRDTFIKTLIELADNDDRVFLITPDLGFSVLEKFQEKFPDRFLNVGIAESNAVSIAAGLSLSGKVVYIYSIIPFVIMRSFEQVRVDVAYMNTNVRLVGVGAGVTYGAAGATHHAIEDISIMRSLPNMTMFSPSDPYEVEQVTKESIDYKGPIYFRLAKKGEPIISNTKKNITLGLANPIRKHKKSKIIILFTSNASDLAIDIEQKLNDMGIKSDLTSIHTIKPFDYEYIAYVLSDKEYIFTIEEHCVIGGLGSAVSEYIAESRFNPIFKRFTLMDEYSHYVGSQSYIREKMGLTVKKIYNYILDVYK